MNLKTELLNSTKGKQLTQNIHDKNNKKRSLINPSTSLQKYIGELHSSEKLNIRTTLSLCTNETMNN